jgi:origin recognition complex subunit 2
MRRQASIHELEYLERRLCRHCIFELLPRVLMRTSARHLDVSSDGGDDQDDISDEESDLDDSHNIPSPRKRRPTAGAAVVGDQPSLIVQTAFDAYFTHSTSRAQTSTNVFSSLVPPLTGDEYAEAMASAATGPQLNPIQPSLLTEPSRTLLFTRFMRELKEGFNLLMYGYGSKRRVLNHFATDYCSKAGHVVVANGFQPDFSLKDLLNSIENVPGILTLDMPSTTIESQTKRIYDFFAEPSQKRHLYIIIHNIDASPLRSAKAKSCLALLALNLRIHIVASIDHINAPLLWSTSESSARKEEEPISGTIPPRGFAWLWHDLTTLAPYDFELAYTDRSSISGAHGGGARKKTDASVQTATAMTETAALHILASVTQKAKKLFALLGGKQMESIEEAGEAASSDLQQYAMGYDALFNAARDDFIATNDTALRSLLGEFRDHSLVVAAQATSGGGEVLWIPLRKERLVNVLAALKADQ